MPALNRAFGVLVFHPLKVQGSGRIIADRFFSHLAPIQSPECQTTREPKITNSPFS